MSGISLPRFISTARDADGPGAIRLAKGTTDGLVNKGTLGNRIAGFFRSGAEAIGLARPDPTKAERQQKALESFRAALQDWYGTTAADAALQATGLGAADGRLTGRSVLAATGLAADAVARTRVAGQAKLATFLPPGPGEPPTARFLQVTREAGMNDLLWFGPAEAAEYTVRLRGAANYESRLNREPLSEQQMARLAKLAMRDAADLARAGKLDGAIAARAASVAAAKGVYQGLAKGEDVGALVGRLAAARDAVERRGAAENLEALGAEEVDRFAEHASRQAVREMRADRASLPREAQANALAEGSTLRAIRFAANEILTDPRSTDAQQGFAHRVGDTGRLAIANLGSMIGAATGRAIDDGDETGISGTIKPPRQEIDAAKAALLAAAEKAQMRDAVAAYDADSLGATRAFATRPDAPGAGAFLDAVNKQHAMENVGFLRAVRGFGRLTDEPARRTQAEEIVRTWVDAPPGGLDLVGASAQVNLAGAVRDRLARAMQQDPLPADLFHEAEKEIASLLRDNVAADLIGEMKAKLR